MLSVLEKTSDESIRGESLVLLWLESQMLTISTTELRHRYVDVTLVIRKVIEETICHIPRVLIDTATGRLCDKTEQVAAFEQCPMYHELRSSMTTRTSLDHARIRREVKRYYRYVMFSHKWENGEPCFIQSGTSRYMSWNHRLRTSSFRTLCKLVRDFEFQWVWSDTCCIDKKDNVVLQESLVAMFTWYHGSSLTLVYLRSVWSQNQKPGDLWRSIWNTRAWTYQEYVAAEIVQFYTEDWKPYLGLDMFNHKESDIIVDEMEQVSRVSAQQLAALRPGLDRVREKLFLASRRQTSLVEDIAYSLLGIFNIAIPVIYGEGNRAVGRLLEHILTGSGDVTILAWTGPAGSYNSCLPLDLTVYDHLVPPHIPQPIEATEMNNLVVALRSASSDHSRAVELYCRLNALPPPSLASTRLRFSGTVFSITELVKMDSESDVHIYRATTSALGEVAIKTRDNLLEMEGLILIHPWISALLDQDFSRARAGVGRDETTQALRLVARLRQPFGALLLAQVSRVQYKRVATDSLSMVRIREGTGLEELLKGVQTVDVQ
ncbi:hypothetical protein JVU11DRAFT_10170 [Chiua virens]|nr:hypothetical protein JVU11DRAFT_10170 [Chiua virens]